MNRENSPPLAGYSREQLREGAVWLSLLHGPGRTEKLERALQRWIAADAGNARAFEKVSLAWEESGSLPLETPPPSRWQLPGFRQGFAQAAAVFALVVALAAGGYYFQQRRAGVVTDIGEERVLTLRDGTRVTLNTDSRMVVDFSDQERHVVLKSGEALFEVAQHGARWPFVVEVDGTRVTALGTEFVVRRDPDRRFAVTLMEGKVSVVLAGNTGERPIPLVPGQRLTLGNGLPPKVDEPSIEKVISWRTGYVDLPEMPLALAVTEMNRYSRMRITLSASGAENLAVSGVFRAGDTASFADAVAASYGLTVKHGPEGILLGGKPRSRPE